MAFLIPMAATAALNAGWISVSTATSALGVASALGTVGTLFGAFGALSAGASAAQTHTDNAAISNYNAQIATRNSAQALHAAEVAAKEQREDTTRRIGSIRSSFGKAGVVTTSGSPLLAVVEQAEEGELEAQKILYKGKLQSQGFDAEAAVQRMIGGDQKRKSSSARNESFMEAGSKILTGRSLLN